MSSSEWGGATDGYAGVSPSGASGVREWGKKVFLLFVEAGATPVGRFEE